VTLRKQVAMVCDACAMVLMDYWSSNVS
jgi:hypothetical protein